MYLAPALTGLSGMSGMIGGAVVAPWSPLDLGSELLQYALDGGNAYESSTLSGFEVLRSLEPYGTYRQPRQGRCYLYDGTNDFSTRGARLTSGSINSGFTISAWLKTTSSGTLAIASELSDTNQSSWYFRLTGGRVGVVTSPNGSSVTATTGTAIINDGIWHHVAFTLSGTTPVFYVDGVVDTLSVNNMGAVFNGTSVFALGCIGINTGLLFHYSGSLRDVRVFNVAKSQSQIQSIMAGNDDTAGLLAHYPCNEESGTIGYDISGNGNHLTHTNITQSTFHATDTSVTVNRNNRLGHRTANNLLLRSEEFDNAYWIKDGSSTVEANSATSPFGQLTADSLLLGTVSGTQGIRRSLTVVPGQRYTLSLHVKFLQGVDWLEFTTVGGGTLRTWFNISSGALGTVGHTTAGVENAGNGWYRAWVTYTPNASSIEIFIRARPANNSLAAMVGTGIEGFLCFGAQYNTGDLLPYTITSASAVSDIVYIPPRLTDNLAADGNALTATGLSPYPATVETPCITGDGTDVQVSLGSTILPATSDFALSLLYFHVTNNTTRRAILYQDAVNIRLQANSTSAAGAVAGALSFSTVSNAIGVVNALAQNTWHRINLTRSGNSWTLQCIQLPSNLSSSATATFSDTLTGSTPSTLLGGSLFNDGRIADLRITTGGVTTFFPLQEGPGTSNTNRNLHFVRSDGTGGVVVNAITNGTVSTIWANRCPGHVRDWATQFGGTVNNNLLVRSQGFDNGSWTKTRTTVSANTDTSPNADLTADKLVETPEAGTHLVTQSATVVSGSTYTFSVHLKPVERNIVYVQTQFAGTGYGGAYITLSGAGTVSNYFNGLGSGVTVTALANGWYRVSLTAASSIVGGACVIGLANTPGSATYTGDGTSGLLVWGAQLELGAGASQYRVTGASAGSGAFVPGHIPGNLCADGNTKTLVAGKFGNPYSRINFNPFTAAEANGLGLATAYAVTNARQSVAPNNTKFRRTQTDGEDRFFATRTALTGPTLTNAEAYVQ